MFKGSTKMMNHSNTQLIEQEPEQGSSACCLILFKLTFWAATACFLFYFVVLTIVQKYGQPKSEMVSYVPQLFLNYPMTSNLLPVYMVSTFEKVELTNRIECLLNRESTACIDYCDTLLKASSNDTVEPEDQWTCYEKYGASRSLYAESKCSFIWDKDKDEGTQYVQCLKEHDATVSQKDNCNLVTNN